MPIVAIDPYDSALAGARANLARVSPASQRERCEDSRFVLVRADVAARPLQ